MRSSPLPFLAGLVAGLSIPVLSLSADTKPPAAAVPDPAAEAAKLFDRAGQIRQALREYPAALNQSPRFDKDLTVLGRHAAACAALDLKYRQSGGFFARELPVAAAGILKGSESDAFDRACAFLMVQKFEDAEIAAIAAKKAAPVDAGDRSLAALETAGLAAAGLTIYTRALQHLEDAAAFTDPARNLPEWQRLQEARAAVLILSERIKDAEPVITKTLEESMRTQGPDTMNTLACRLNLARVLAKAGNSAEAETHFRTITDTNQRLMGADNPLTIASRNDLTDALLYAGDYAKAVAEARLLTASRTRVLGPDHPDTLESHNIIGIALLQQGKAAEAEQEYLIVLTACLRLFGADGIKTLDARTNLAGARNALGRTDEALTELRAVLATREKSQGEGNPVAIAGRKCIGELLQQAKRYKEAEAEFRKYLDIVEKFRGANHPDTLNARVLLAGSLYSLNKDDDVEATLAPVLAAHTKNPDASTIRAHYQMAFSLEARGDDAAKKGDAKAARAFWEKALASARVASESGAKILPKDDSMLKAYQELVPAIGEKLKVPEVK